MGLGRVLAWCGGGTGNEGSADLPSLKWAQPPPEDSDRYLWPAKGSGVSRARKTEIAQGDGDPVRVLKSRNKLIAAALPLGRGGFATVRIGVDADGAPVVIKSMTGCSGPKGRYPSQPADIKKEVALMRHSGFPEASVYVVESKRAKNKYGRRVHKTHVAMHACDGSARDFLSALSAAGLPAAADLDMRLLLASRTAKAVIEFHEPKGGTHYIHGDLSDGNVLASGADVIVADFGCARPVGSSTFDCRFPVLRSSPLLALFETLHPFEDTYQFGLLLLDLFGVTPVIDAGPKKNDPLSIFFKTRQGQPEQFLSLYAEGIARACADLDAWYPDTGLAEIVFGCLVPGDGWPHRNAQAVLSAYRWFASGHHGQAPDGIESALMALEAIPRADAAAAVASFPNIIDRRTAIGQCETAAEATGVTLDRSGVCRPIEPLAEWSRHQRGAAVSTKAGPRHGRPQRPLSGTGYWTIGTEVKANAGGAGLAGDETGRGDYV